MSTRRARLDGVLVATRGNLADLPPLHLPEGTEIRPLDLHDPTDTAVWLDVHNRSYGHRWTVDELRAAVLEHRSIRVTQTFVLLDRGDAVAVASIGRFRADEAIGAGHYLGVVPDAQRRRLGFTISVHRYRALRDEGVETAESQTHIARTGSLLIHFDCGFRPKWRLDPWNNPDTWSRGERLIADVRLAWLYSRWRFRRLTQ